jgi:hypothetical protein
VARDFELWATRIRRGVIRRSNHAGEMTAMLCPIARIRARIQLDLSMFERRLVAPLGRRGDRERTKHKAGYAARHAPHLINGVPERLHLFLEPRCRSAAIGPVVAWRRLPDAILRRHARRTSRAVGTDLR